MCHFIFQHSETNFCFKTGGVRHGKSIRRYGILYKHDAKTLTQTPKHPESSDSASATRLGLRHTQQNVASTGAFAHGFSCLLAATRQQCLP